MRNHRSLISPGRRNARPFLLLALATALATAMLTLAGAAPGANDTPSPSASAPIAVGIDNGGGPYVTAYDQAGNWKAGFLPYFDFTQGGIDVAAGDVDGTGKSAVITVPGRGGRGEIREFDGAGKQEGPTPLATASGCGTRVAAGDVNGDGKADLVTSFETCGGPEVQVFDGSSGTRLADFRAFNTDSALPNGVRVAAGDVNGDGKSEIIVGGGPGDPATVEIFPGEPTGLTPQPLRTIDAFGPTVTSGVEVASADVNGDGKADVIAAAETPDDAQIKIFDGTNGTLLDSFHPFGLVSGGTLRIAAGDLNGDGHTEIVVGASQGYEPQLRIFAPDGTKLADIEAPFYNGRSLAVGDFDGGKAEIAMGSGPSYQPTVAIFDTAGTLDTTFEPYGPSFTNGVRVAVGDLNGDGALEYVTGQGWYGDSELAVLDAQGDMLRDLHPFGDTWQGLYVAAGDVNGDGKAEIVAGAGQWEEPRVKVLDGTGRELASFLAFDADFQGGVRVATGDLAGNGTAEIVAGAGPGGPPVVRVFDASGQRKLSFYAFDPSYTGGVYVAAGDVDGDGKAEIVVGSGTTGEVRVFDAQGNLKTSFQAYQPDQAYYDGTRVAVGDVNGDGVAEIVTGPGRVRPVDVETFTGDGKQIGTFRANQDFQGGIYVAVPAPLGPHLADAAASPVRGTEGKMLQLTASFVDPRGGATPEQFAATISWGDAGDFPATVSALGDGRYEVAGRHAYDRFGHYPVTVHVSDIHLRAVSIATTAVVQDARLIARGRSIRTHSRVFKGVLATVRDSNPDGLAGDLRASVVWGDGTSSGARVYYDFLSDRISVLGKHHYRKPGVYRAVVRVRSLGGSTARATTAIRIGGSPGV